MLRKRPGSLKGHSYISLRPGVLPTYFETGSSPPPSSRTLPHVSNYVSLKFTFLTFVHFVILRISIRVKVSSNLSPIYINTKRMCH